MLLQPTPVVPRASALAVAPALLGLLILAVTVTRTTTESRFYKKRRTQLNIAATAEPAAEPAAAQAFVPDPSQHVLWFNQVGKSAGGWVGGKGANLGEMASAGMPVPPGFCITKGAFDLHLASTGTQDLLQRIERGELSTKQAHAAVLDSAMHAQVEAQVRQAYAKLGDGKTVVAVRSSATAEDSADASFAGQLDTFLGVQGADEVVRAVKECWASLYSDRVDSYRRLAGKGRGGAGAGGASVSCCVVVQTMLDADVAGVLFTANPFNQSLGEFVITANWGLGESVVADIASPDTWVVDASSRAVLSEKISVKQHKVVLNPAAARQNRVGHVGGEDKQAGTSVTVPVPAADQARACLSAEQVQALVALGTKVQRHYRAPQDVEWGLKNGQLFLLQARPITTLKPKDQAPAPTIDEFDGPCRPDDWITTCNAAEMFPGPMTPLTMSTFGRMADEGVQRMQVEFGVRRLVDRKNPVTANYSGNFFLNMTNTLAPMAAGMIGAGMAKENGEMSILGSLNSGETLQRLIACGGGLQPLPVRALNGMRYLKTMFFAGARVPVMQGRIKFCERELAVARGGETAQSLWGRIDELMDMFDDQWTDGIVTSSTSAAFMLACMKLLTRRGEDIWATQPVAELAALLGEVDEHRGVAESAGAVGALDALRDCILQAGGGGFMSAKDFCALPPALALEFVRSPQAGKVQSMFAELIARHGHRCVREAEMREKDWCEDPVPLIKMLQSSVKAGMAGKSQKGVVRRGLDPASIVRSKPHLNFLTRPLLRACIGATRSKVHLRELGKSLQVKLNSVFKHAYRRLGALLAAEGRLSDPDLLYFLTHAEAGLLASLHKDDPKAHFLRTRAMQRRRLLPSQAALKFAELHCGKPVPLRPAHGGGQRDAAAASVLKGTPVSAGVCRGPCRVARTVEEAEALKEGEILVTPQTDVGWTPFFSRAAALVTEIGGMLSHGAVVAREYSLPCVVGVTGACDMLRTGMIVELDGDAGIVTVLQAAPAACSPNLSAAAGPARAVDLKGTPVSSGVARGRARVARTLEEAEAMVEGEILITPQTDVGWTPYFSMAAGLCTEIGGMLSHGAVVAREYSLPCVVGVGGACDEFKTGMRVELNGDTGVVRALADHE